MNAVGILGASGFIGREIVRRAGARDVFALGRRPVPGCAFRRADLREAFEPRMLEGIGAVLHLAADTSGHGAIADAEIAFATALAADCRKRAIPMVFVSSQVASSHAPTAYGRTKAEIEARVLAEGAVVVRPGLVYGGTPAGLFGMLESLVRRSPILPDLRPRPRVQPIHVRDLADALLVALGTPELRGRVLQIAGPPVTFIHFLQSIARERLGVTRIAVPVPVSALRGVLSLAGRVLGPHASAGRLDSLVSIPPMDCDDDLAQLGVVPRELTSGVTRSGCGRRALLAEARDLVSATVGQRAPTSLMRRYVRGLERRGIAGARTARGGRAAIQSRDHGPRSDVGSVAWRIGVAQRLAESEPMLAGAFLPCRTSRTSALRDFALAGFIEARARVLRPWFRWLGGRSG